MAKARKFLHEQYAGGEGKSDFTKVSAISAYAHKYYESSKVATIKPR